MTQSTERSLPGLFVGDIEKERTLLAKTLDEGKVSAFTDKKTWQRNFDRLPHEAGELLEDWKLKSDTIIFEILTDLVGPRLKKMDQEGKIMIWKGLVFRKFRDFS